jgi:hypothetical protein
VIDEFLSGSTEDAGGLVEKASGLSSGLMGKD